MVNLAAANQEQVKSGPAVSLNPLRRSLNWLSKVSKDRKVLALLAILALGAYLRLWNLHHLFNAIHDYDEGIYSLGARFISQGYLPYQDFILAHPPLHSFTLTSIYELFGYDFFYGKYLSVVLSLACIVLIYLVGKKMYHPGVGLAAAALFAVSPEMVYFGRRVVQESMGIFFVIIAVYFAFDFINNNKNNRLFFCGLALSLAVATKYIFIPAAVAIIVAIILLNMGERFWGSLKTLGRPTLWVMYICFAAIFYSLLLLLKWSLALDVSIPFLDPMYLSVGNVVVAIFVFILPLVVSLVMLEKHYPFREWWLGIWELRHNKGLWLLLAGTGLGYIVVTGFFWVKMPQEFVYQTVLMQQARPYLEFPSLAAMIRAAPLASGFLRMAFLPTLLVIPLTFVLLNKQSFSKNDCFLSVAIIVSLVLCQGFYHLPRYYVSLFPFLLLGVASLMLPLNVKMLTAKLQSIASEIKAGLLVVFTTFFLFLSLSIVLLTNYTGYDINWPWFASNEEQVYHETIDYLEGAGAKKVYAVNPIFTAMSQNLESTLAFDSFALIWLEGKPSEEIIEDRIDEGVDYIVLDSWVRYWGYPYDKQARELTQAVRSNARLVKVIAPDSLISTEIYALGVETQGVFNGDFDQWVKTDEISQPLGWEPVTITGDGDKATIEQTSIAGVECASFTIYEDGLRSEEYDTTHAGISQDIPFPEMELKVQVFPTVNTETTGRVVIGPGIHFVDKEGHALVIGFSDEVDEEEVFKYGDGSNILIVKHAQLNQWSEHTVDLSSYWNKANWWQPEEIRVYLLISTYYSEPGYYAFYVAKVEAEAGQAVPK